MVVGGEKDGVIATDKGYIISLDDNVPIPSCIESLCDFPHYFYSATSGIFEDGLPTVCGGRNLDRPGPLEYYGECYKFNYTNAWEQAGSMSYELSHAGEFKVFS